jgi:predicted  nucleic acid-binding Zn-ribbon protein
MNSTDQTPQNSSKLYKTNLLEARKLRERSGANAYKRIVLLSRVYHDEEFRADNDVLDDLKLADLLDDYVDDLCLSFLELEKLLEYYPRKEQWADGKIWKMRQKMISGNRLAPSAKRSPKQRQIEDQLTQARREKVRQRAIIDQLMARIKQLEEENEALNVKIAELEALLETETQPA